MSQEANSQGEPTADIIATASPPTVTGSTVASPAAVASVMQSAPILPSQSIGVQLAVGQNPTLQDTIANKLTDAQITAVIAQSGRDSEQKHKERLWSMNIGAGIVGATFILVLFMSWLFLSYQQTAPLEKILNLILGFAAGAGGGFGLGRYTASKPETK